MPSAGLSRLTSLWQAASTASLPNPPGAGRGVHVLLQHLEIGAGLLAPMGEVGQVLE
jgi:hypothetical protein